MRREDPHSQKAPLGKEAIIDFPYQGNAVYLFLFEKEAKRNWEDQK